MGCGPCWAFAGRRDGAPSLWSLSSRAAAARRAPLPGQGEASACAADRPLKKTYNHPSLHRADPARVNENELRLKSLLANVEDSAELDLSSLDLWSVPSLVLACPSIRRLVLTSNCIYELPAEIASLTALETLDVSRNRLKVLPEAIGALSSLRELNAMTNHLRQVQHSIPLAALKALMVLRHVDLRFNPKLMSATLADVLAAHVPAGCTVLVGVKPTPKQLSAGERDATLLRSQLEPWSTPALRRRLADLFGMETDPNETDREGVFKLLLEAYAVMGPRAVRLVRGTPPPPTSVHLLVELLEEMRGTVFPEGAQRERQQIRAQGYIILRRPLAEGDEGGTGGGEEEAGQAADGGSGAAAGGAAAAAAAQERQHGMRPERPMPELRPGAKLGWKRRTAAAKFQQHAKVWDLAYALMESVDPAFAAMYTAIAMTKNFVGSPHVDTENVGPFYGLALGDFEGGGICVESTPLEVTQVDTRYRFGKVDGRFPHWVAPYTGERYSVIYYQTAGPVAPKTSAVFAAEQAL